MRVGLTVSLAGHALLIGMGLLTLHRGQPLESEKIVALPVDLVSVADETDLKKGNEKARELPKKAEQPKPVAQAPTPAPKPTPKPDPKPVEAAAEPPPPPAPAPTPEPKPAPKPEPDQIAALADPKETPAAEPPPPAETPDAAPLEHVPTDVRKPRARPRPPVAEQPKPKTEHPPVPKKPKDDFNADDIAALLNKQKPQGGGDPDPASEPQTIGSISGRSDAAMTQDEIAALKARLFQCWNPPVGVREANGLVVEVQINLQPDGSLTGPPTILRVENVSDPLSQVAAEAAIRAVVTCAPFGDILKPEKYAQWNTIDFVFDPREMLGG